MLTLFEKNGNGGTDMKKCRVINHENIVLMIMSKLDNYGVDALWKEEVSDGYDPRCDTYTGIHNACDFICDKCKDLEELLDILLRYVPGKLIDDTIKEYFRGRFIGEEYAHELFSVKGEY